MKNKRFFCVMILGFFLLTLSACGGGGGSDPTPPATSLVTLCGGVRGDTLAGVTINFTGATTYSLTTNEQGNIGCASLPNGAYTVTPVKAGYTFTPSSLAVNEDNGNMIFVATANSGLPYTIIGAVSGAVLSGVTITLSGAGSATTTTDVSGDFSFPNLVKGNYTVTPSMAGYTFTPSSRVVTISDWGGYGIGPFVATANTVPTYSISGTVSGAVTNGVTITLTGSGSTSTTTDSNGNYTFTGAQNGSYTVTPSMTGYTFTPSSRAVTVSGANITGTNFVAAANSAPTYNISGTVSGAVTNGVTITLTGSGSTSTTTDSNGNYTFTGAQNGSYTVTPSMTGYTFAPSSRAVTVSGANITGTNFVAYPGDVIGTVITSFTATPATITAGQSATLMPVFSNATSASIDNGVGIVISGAGYTVWPVETTTYRLTAYGTGGPLTRDVTITVTVTPLPGVWTSGGPYGGDVLALAINPTTPSTLYVGTSGGVTNSGRTFGVLKSTDSGATWAAANTGLSIRSVYVLAIDPTTPATLSAGTNDGVFKSIDSGGTWTEAGTGLTNRTVYALAIDPTTPATLYAGTNGGVFKSTDSAGIWSPANTGLTSTSVYALTINPTTPATLYAGTSPNGIFKSTDSGGTWAAANTGIPYLTFAVYALAINPTTPATLYAGTNVGIFKSTSSGSTWAAANTGMSDLNVNALAINPSTPTTLFVGTSGAGVFKSTNSGGTWVATGLPLNILAIAINPSTSATLYAGAHADATQRGGVFKSTDSGNTWVAKGLPLDVKALVINPVTPSTIYAGTSSEDGAFKSSGGVFKSTDSGRTWAAANTGLTNLDVKALVINPTTPSTLYAGTSGGVFRSIDSGGTWTNATNSGLTVIVDALAVNPLTPATLYAGMMSDSWAYGGIGLGSGGVFKSTDSGGTWTDANSGLVSQVVNALAINPTTPSTLYAAMELRGVFKSINSGGTWTAINTGLPPDFANCPYSPYMCPNFYALAINPTTPSTLYAGVSGGYTYSGPWYDTGVYKSTNSGGSWAAANTGLANQVVYALAINPTTPATLYAGTYYGGVFKSTDSGTTWAAANTGLPNVPVLALTLDPTGATTLYAGLGYGGVWQCTPK